MATVAPSATVAELIAVLTSKNVGALPVVDADRLVGIVSERDVVRRLGTVGEGLLSASVAEIMTTDVATCAPRTGWPIWRR